MSTPIALQYRNRWDWKYEQNYSFLLNLEYDVQWNFCRAFYPNCLTQHEYPIENNDHLILLNHFKNLCIVTTFENPFVIDNSAAVSTCAQIKIEKQMLTLLTEKDDHFLSLFVLSSSLTLIIQMFFYLLTSDRIRHKILSWIKRFIILYCLQ